MFHNYIWMSAGGVALWALATAGEDAAADRLFEQIRQRFNRGLYPAWRYLDGLPSEPMGYWALYVFTPGVWTLLAAQSAFETDLVGTVRTRHGDWLDRNFENLIHSTLPDMRYIPWGDLQGGPNGSVTHEMAGVIDGATWALRSPHGARFSRWLQAKRGLERFYGETAMFYMLYARQPQAEPADPPLSFLAGNRQSGHFIARSGWDDGATVVAFRCTDHFGDHHHYDQGSFLIWRNGLLAVDPPVYRKVRGPQQLTEHHNTLLLGGRPQRPVRGQWFVTVEDFQKNLQGGRKLETGDILFSHDAGTLGGRRRAVRPGVRRGPAGKLRAPVAVRPAGQGDRRRPAPRRGRQDRCPACSGCSSCPANRASRTGGSSRRTARAGSAAGPSSLPTARCRRFPPRRSTRSEPRSSTGAKPSSRWCTSWTSATERLPALRLPFRPGRQGRTFT